MSGNEDLGVNTLLGFTPAKADILRFYQILVKEVGDGQKMPPSLTETQARQIIVATIRFLFGEQGMFRAQLNRSLRRRFLTHYSWVFGRVLIERWGEERAVAYMVIYIVLYLLEGQGLRRQLVHRQVVSTNTDRLLVCPQCGGTSFLIDSDDEANIERSLKCATCGFIGLEGDFLPRREVQRE